VIVDLDSEIERERFLIDSFAVVYVSSFADYAA
jgi:hypothetical protein